MAWIETVTGTLVNIDRIEYFSLVMFHKGHYGVIDDEDSVYCEGDEAECEEFMSALKSQLVIVRSPKEYNRGMDKSRRMVDEGGIGGTA